MVKITTSISKKQYITIMRNYLINKKSYKIISILLFLMLLYSTISAILFTETTNFQSLIIWWILTITYITLIPIIITNRANSIYNNTKFLHSPMSFSFSEHKIEWNTSVGSRDIDIISMYKIETTKYALMLAFSPYQILCIPYQDISKEQWQNINSIITACLKKRANINSKYYFKSRV